MFRRQALRAFRVTLVASLAGCLSTVDVPGRSATQVVELSFSNNSERVLRLTAAIFRTSLGGVTITYRDGRAETFPDADSLVDIPESAWDGAVTFDPLGDDAVVRRFRSTGGSGFTTTYEELPRGITVVTLVADPSTENSALGVSSETCRNSESASFRISVEVDGEVSVSTACGTE